MKMKRKDLEEVNDEFSDFSLSSPARKIRRLDAELPPIMEEEEPDIPPVFEQSMLEDNFGSNMGHLRGLVIEELPTAPESEERAIVLFKPVILQSPSAFSVSVNPDIISGLKNHILWSSESDPLKASDKAERQGKNLGVANECLAVVPWAPSQFPSAQHAEVPQTDVSDLMEAEEMEAAAMDIEDNNVGIEQRPGDELGPMSVSEGLRQWQHCMVPQPPQDRSTPIVWFP